MPLPLATPSTLISLFTDFTNIQILLQQQYQQQYLQLFINPLAFPLALNNPNSNTMNNKTLFLALNKPNDMNNKQENSSASQTILELTFSSSEVGKKQSSLQREFFDDMDEHLKKDSSITAPITSDSINRVKCKLQKTKNNNDDDEFHILIKEQTETIIESIKDQYDNTFKA
ncbi:7334_t:CDS:2 [Scutellospora calospora]|uniref:7334_t:CDS:1 n=1 Tax=Scutellospora calospora TaxID=85575 RepID=A0ACA9KP08_9GLOM|nr:7334_t:CDS:2 [Scutellospora calospora]